MAVAAMADTLAAALWLAERGLHVFDVDHPELPRCAGIRTPAHDPATCTDRGKHPCGKWSTAASVDREQVTAMFAGTTRNIGIACGPSGLLVVDEDAPDAFASYATSIGQQVPATFTVATGKGRHYYFRAPDGFELGNRTGALKGHGIDVRGRGGYVVGPGSTHATGRAYTVESEAEVVRCPAWLVDALTNPAGDRGGPHRRIRRPARGHPRTARRRQRRATRRADALRHQSARPRAAHRRGRGADGRGLAALRDEARALLVDVYERYPAGRSEDYRPSAPTVLDDPDAEFERQAHHERQVAVKLAELRVLDEARHRLTVERHGRLDPPQLLTLRERLARPRPPTSWRIHDWQPAGSRVVLSAQYKSGKTTLVGNLVRCLVDGDDWLGRHEVAPVTGTVVVLDFEMSPDQLDDWLRDQRIVNDDRVHVEPMRGRAAVFDLLDDRMLTRWAELLRARDASYLVVDCLRPILDALGLDEHHDAGRFLVRLDRLLTEAGIPDATVVHHMGHTGERSRGDSRIRDWPDVEWRLVRQDDQPGSARYISAYGRDVDIVESELLYDPTSRHLTVGGGSRRDAAIRAALRDIKAALAKADEPLTGRAIELALAGSEHSRAAIRRGLALGIRNQVVKVVPGPRRSTLHSLAEMSEKSAPSEYADQDQTTITTEEQCADDPE
jgi:hypothetical protein